MCGSSAPIGRLKYIGAQPFAAGQHTLRFSGCQLPTRGHYGHTGVRVFGSVRKCSQPFFTAFCGWLRRVKSR